MRYGIHMKKFTGILKALTMAALTLAFVIPAITHDAPLGSDFIGAPGTVPPSAAIKNIPVMTAQDAKNFPTCSPVREGHPVARVLVVHTDATRSVMTFTKAWNITHSTNHNAPDLWVIGGCK